MRIALTGAAGRMGRMIAKEILETQGCELAGALEGSWSPAVGRDVGELAGGAALGVAVSADAEAVIGAAEAVIDFSAPAATAVYAEIAAAQGTALITGTTGLDAAEQKAVEAAAARICLVQAANMSVGINLLLGVVRRVAAMLGEDYDAEIVEMHHRHKVDAPSGTALALGGAVAAGRGVDLSEAARRTRDGQVGARPAGEIGFATLRGGDVVGEHSVIFAGDGESIVLSHQARSREILARGAVRAALWTKGRKPGLYGMADVLGLGD